MNEEYMLLAGIYWKLKGIPVYFWRNHPRGSILTTISIYLSTKTLSTSTKSFSAKFGKTIIMPAGVDDQIFKPIPGVVRKKYSILMVGRISPIKHIDLALEAFRILISRGVQVSLTIVGSTSDKDNLYLSSLEKYISNNNLSGLVHFVEAVEHSKLSEIYSSHELILNLTETGSFDKTIVEGIFCGAVPVVSNESLRHMLPDICITSQRKEEIADSLQTLLNPHEQVKIYSQLKEFAESQSLTSLVKKLSLEMK